ncbi:MAG: ROK family protein [Lachnospiraceae bacterium]|nr:ROK family protein [Lachnospiraceae bacterium]
MDIIVGIDIGGTKCAVSYAFIQNEIQFLDKTVYPTILDSFERMMDILRKDIDTHLQKYPLWKIKSIGISCGGPLNAETGDILSPPNLKRWGDVNCYQALEKYQVPVLLQNDANACALAEWKFGAGRGSKNMVFLTFGTGMGAGLILNGELYTGACDLAGEVGHIRLEEDGPEGYGKYGSFEGFCSGGGIRNLGIQYARKAWEAGQETGYCKNEAGLNEISAKSIAEALQRQDETAKQVYRTVGLQLGKGLAILIDILNPDKIVIGSIFERQESVLRPYLEEALQKEALPEALKCCTVVKTKLGDLIGDYAAISVGLVALEKEGRQ